jgi:hypothetical protein
MGDARRRKLRQLQHPYLRWVIIASLIVVVCAVGFLPYLIAHANWISPSGRSLLIGTLLLLVGIDMVQASYRMSLGLGWLVQGALAAAGGVLLLGAFGFV